MGWDVAVALLGCRSSTSKRAEGCWIPWLGVQGMQDTMIRGTRVYGGGAQYRGEGIQEGAEYRDKEVQEGCGIPSLRVHGGT